MATLLLTGGTGLIGRHLTRMILDERPDDAVIILTRNARKASVSPRLRYAGWDPDAGTIDASVVQEADVVIHLAGAGIADHRWTASYKQDILDSRRNSARVLIQALSGHENHVHTVIAASAIGFYGADKVPERPFREADTAGNDFLAAVCRQWEQSMAPVRALGKRLVVLRTGLVFTPEGGTLGAFRPLARLGLAPVLGSGKQVYSWIAMEDLCRMYLFMADQKPLDGVFNAVAPHPETEAVIACGLAQQIKGRHIKLPVPAFALKIMLGELATELLKSQTVSAAGIQENGFNFHFDTFSSFLKNL